MPNWCETDVTIKGSARALDALYDRVLATADPITDTHPSLLEAYLPMPEVLIDTRPPGTVPYSDHALAAADPTSRQRMQEENVAVREEADQARALTGFDNWWDWAIAHWGTKWSDDTYYYLRRPRSILLSFQTPWSPPLAGVQTISAVTDLTFSLRYYEAGVGFQGYAIYRSGDLVRNDVWDYSGRRGG